MQRHISRSSSGSHRSSFLHALTYNHPWYHVVFMEEHADIFTVCHTEWCEEERLVYISLCHMHIRNTCTLAAARHVEVPPAPTRVKMPLAAVRGVRAARSPAVSRPKVEVLPYITSRAAAATLSSGPPSVAATAAGPPSGARRAAVTLSRRAAAWFTRSTTDCSAFPTSSDIATFHIASGSDDEATSKKLVRDDVSGLSK